jgi:HlyD family secretion protein
MADKRKIIIPIVILVVVLGTALFFIFKKKGPDDVIYGSGTIEATEVDVSTRISGEVTEILVGEGDQVEEGDLLAEIESKELDAQRIGAEAVLDEAEKNFARMRELYHAGGVSRMELDRTETLYLSAKSQLDFLDATLSDSEILSPITGVVLSKNIETGEVVFPGVPILTIADLRFLWIKIYVSEPVMGLIALNDVATINVDSYPGRDFVGVVTFISQEPEFTPKNVQTEDERTKLVFGVKIELENRDLALKPGMPADAVIKISK